MVVLELISVPSGRVMFKYFGSAEKERESVEKMAGKCSLDQKAEKRTKKLFVP